MQLILALLTLKHPRSIRGGLLPHQYINKHTLICVRYTYVHDFFYMCSYVTWPNIVSLITFTLYTAICIHNYTCISKHTRQEALACVFARDLNLPRGVLQNPQNPPQLRLCMVERQLVYLWWLLQNMSLANVVSMIWAEENGHSMII